MEYDLTVARDAVASQAERQSLAAGTPITVLGRFQKFKYCNLLSAR